MSNTISATLRQQALQAVRDADPSGPGGVRMQATKLLRDRVGSGVHTLSDLLGAVEWAQEQPADLSRFVADRHGDRSDWWLFRFPNGRTVSVVPDPHPDALFRFEIQVDNAEPVGYLTTGQVEAKLAAVYALPAAPATIAEGQ